MKVIEISKKTSKKTEQMEMAIAILCIVNGIHLSKTEISVLAHYMAFGVKESTDDLILKSEIVKDMNSLRNRKTRLLKLGFLKRTKELYKSYELNLNGDYKNSDKIALIIKLDNS